MNKFLSIVIPHYSEEEKDIFPLLSSISGQVGVDFDSIETIVVSDGGAKELHPDFLDIFKMKVDNISLDENVGPGLARQAGLDAAKGTYVMFCDADDTLHNVGVLGALMEEANSNVPDILSSDWLEEMMVSSNPPTYNYFKHSIENTWMHGKLLRRKFLEKNNIRFHKDLRVHEDSYFLSIASSFSQRSLHLPIVTYVWKYGPESITRRENGIYTYSSFPTFIEACCMAHEEIKSVSKEQMEYRILQFIMYVYFTLNRPEWWTNEYYQYLLESQEMFRKRMAPFWSWWNNASSDSISRIYNQERNKIFNGMIEREILADWIRSMKCESEKV